MESKIKNYMANIELLKSNFKWKLNLNTMSLLSAIYVVNDKVIDIDELKSFSKDIHKKVSWFSPFRSYQKYYVSAYLISKYLNPQQKLEDLFRIFYKLKKNKLPNNAYTIISSLSLLNICQDGDFNNRIIKIKELYKGMKENHFFLTSNSDYPLATLLSMVNKETDSIIDEIEFYYQNLSMQGFKKGNDLQFLSHILMILNKDNKNELIRRVAFIKNNLIKSDFKIKTNHYATIGILSAIDLSSEDYELLKDLLEILNHNKYTKYTKQINMIIVTMILVSEKIKDYKNLLEANLFTTVESIIQAQNAALIAVISSSAAVSSAQAAS